MTYHGTVLRRTTSALLAVFFLFGCASKVAKAPRPSPDREISRIPVSRPSVKLGLVPESSVPSFSDDLDRNSLNLAVERSLQYLGRFQDSDINYFGDRPCTVREMRETLNTFTRIMNGPETDKMKEERIKKTFSFYQSVGDDGMGHVIFTGYYEPLLAGSLSKTEKYRYPLYRVPNPFPSYKRSEIEGSRVLAGRNLEIVWVSDYVELFFLHVQGSGKIQLPDGRIMQVGYAQSNGHPYRSIANFLIQSGKLPRTEHTQPAIKKYLRDHPEEMMDILNYNERYIFFRVLDSGPVGALSIPVTGGRTIASDLEIFPRGALALIKTRKPLIYINNVSSWAPFTRFVLNQDAGAAITGAGRIDLFCGSGNEAEQVAGRLKESGELYFLIRK